jgi:transposase
MVAKETMMPAPRKYPPEFRERAVRLVREDGQHGAIARIADQLGVNRETLRNWVRQAQVDDGERSGTTSDEAEELKRLRKENAELKRANAILKSASAFFAAELDRPQR